MPAPVRAAPVPAPARAVGGEHGVSARPDRPPIEQARALAGWLAGPRSRALQRATIGRRERVLDAGSGHGIVTAELARRAAGATIALDIDAAALAGGDYPAEGARVCGDARALPFRDASFDLVFFQNVLLWVGDTPTALAEAARVLAPEGALVALEPDYGGMMEHPDLGLRAIWLDALERAGADPLIGRRLPGLCAAVGLQPWVELTHIPAPAEAKAPALLLGLPLTPDERRRVEGARPLIAAAAGGWSVFLHVPYLLVVAHRD